MMGHHWKLSFIYDDKAPSNLCSKEERKEGERSLISAYYIFFSAFLPGRPTHFPSLVTRVTITPTLTVKCV